MEEGRAAKRAGARGCIALLAGASPEGARRVRDAVGAGLSGAPLKKVFLPFGRLCGLSSG
ncbi:hypothetical protein DA2_2782 [Desulfovibrio sp. A2]|nr:hypothetical protein DA2_2782 [Desulfovibrio sp. A2]